MRTNPAIVVSVDRSACTLRMLGSDGLVHATLSERLGESGIRLRPGDVVSVNQSVGPPQVVYLWWKATVVEAVGTITVATYTGKQLTASVLDGLELAPVAGATVFLDRFRLGRGPQIVDIGVDGEPAHPERFMDATYAEIRARVTREVGPSRLGEPFGETPEPLVELADLMSTYPRTWGLCGGWAVDAWLGRETRMHGDVDFAVLQDDHRELFDHLAGWSMVAHDPTVAGDTTDPWDGRRVELPGHIHAGKNVRVGERLDSTAEGFNLDIQVNGSVDGEWVFSRDPWITLPLDRCIQPTFTGLPTLVAEGVLFHKASGLPKDTVDFLTLVPHLDEGQRLWLRDALSAVLPDHDPLVRCVC